MNSSNVFGFLPVLSLDFLYEKVPNLLILTVLVFDLVLIKSKKKFKNIAEVSFLIPNSSEILLERIFLVIFKFLCSSARARARACSSACARASSCSSSSTIIILFNNNCSSCS